jgi:hypothetical protein
MREIESLVEAYLIAERTLVAVVECPCLMVAPSQWVAPSLCDLEQSSSLISHMAKAMTWTMTKGMA